MLKKDLFSLINGLDTVKNLKGVKFAYAVIKNKKLIQKELKLLQETIKSSDKILAYEKQRTELCEKYCARDKEGKPVIKNNAYGGLKENKKFNKKVEDLKKEFKTAITEKKKQYETYNKKLDEEIKLNFHKVLLQDVPNDITSQQLEAIIEIVKEHI